MSKTPFRILIVVFLISASMVASQGQIYRSYYQNPAMQCDSLQRLVDAMNVELDQADSLLNTQTAEMEMMKESYSKKEESVQKMEQFVEVYKAENASLNQTNKILIIFNCLGAVLLLLSLVYILSGRNKSRRPEATVPAPPPTSYPTMPETPVMGRAAVGVEDRLIQIERLARLREGGLLSTTEFEKEKERILRGN